MSVESLLPWAYFWVILLLITMALTPALFFIHFFVPKAMLRTYFKEPYFSSTELAFFSAFPFFFMRTAMFMRLAAWPSSGKRRGLTEAYKLAPPWFRVISKIFIVVLLVFFPPTAVFGVILSIAFCYLGHC